MPATWPSCAAVFFAGGPRPKNLRVHLFILESSDLIPLPNSLPSWHCSARLFARISALRPMRFALDRRACWGRPGCLAACTARTVAALDLCGSRLYNPDTCEYEDIKWIWEPARCAWGFNSGARRLDRRCTLHCCILGICAPVLDSQSSKSGPQLELRPGDCPSA